jgi:hypothetical protein
MQRVTSIGIGPALGIVSALLALALYGSTLAPTLTWGWRRIGVDGGELLAAAESLGVPHPSGYPTFMLLLKGFGTLVPVGSFAFRGNLASALMAAATVGLLYWLVYRIVRQLATDAPRAYPAMAAALGALTFGSSPLFWSQAVITEVYTLNTLFVAALAVQTTYIVFGRSGKGKPDRRVPPGLLAATGVTLGLGMGNHLTLAAVALPLAVWIWARAEVEPRGWLWAAGGLLLGLSVYLYLPLRAAAGPAVNWGDASTAGGFYWMLSGQAYQDYVFGVPIESLWDKLVTWVELVFTQLNPLGIFLALIGMLALWRAQRWVLFSTGTSAIGLMAYSLLYNTFDSQVLTIPAFFVMSTYVGVGAYQVFVVVSQWAAENAAKDFSPRWIGKLVTGWAPIAALATIAFASVPAAAVVLNYEAQNLRGDSEAFEFAEAVLDIVPPGAVVISDTEEKTFALWYMVFVERPESRVVPISGRLLQFDWYWRNLNERYPGLLPGEFPGDAPRAVEQIVDGAGQGSGVYLTYRDLFLDRDYQLISAAGGIYRFHPRAP